MKIIYAASDRPGSAVQLKGFLDNFKGHEVRVAAYSSAQRFIPEFDWTLDTTYYDSNFDRLQYDINLFEPDFIITDYEPIIAGLGKWLNIPVICASPIHIFDAVHWMPIKGAQRYIKDYKSHWEILNSLSSELRLITSPFTNFQLKPGNYEWIEPYYNAVENTADEDVYALAIIEDRNRLYDLQTYFNYANFTVKSCSRYDSQYLKLLSGCDFVISTGETGAVTDALFNNKPLALLLNNDPECIWNNIAGSYSKHVFNLERLELMEQLGVELLNKCFETRHKLKPYIKANNKKLHERIEEICKHM